MIVVADSGPPHYLSLLDQIELLQHLYGQVFIPEAVANELRAAGSPLAVSKWIARPPDWVSILAVAQKHIASVTDRLDLGERAAIALARTIRADLLLIDESAGRGEAMRRKLRVTGTLGVLRASAEQGLIDVPDTLSRLRATSFYADDALINSIFARWLRP
jgi:predicted nucleic acid-binding protein